MLPTEVGLTGDSSGVAAQPVSALPPTQQLAKNPQLPQHPLGAYTDAQYEAGNAALKSSIAKQYADILQQLGYIDPTTGQFVMGSVETAANRERGLLNRDMGLAREGVTREHQQLGTLFSGLRGTDQARAEFPMTDRLGQLETETPMTLASLYEKAGGLMGDYTIQDNGLLADAAQRRAADLASTGAGGTSTGGEPTNTANETTDTPTDTGGVDTTPTPDPSPPLDTQSVNYGAPQDTAFGGLNGPYIGTLPDTPNPAATTPEPYTPPPDVQSVNYGAPQDQAFGGHNGPYIGTLPTIAPEPAPAPYVAPPTAPTTNPGLMVGDTSGVSEAARRKLMQWG